MLSTDTKVMIVGGGLSGLVCAALCRHAGISYVLYDKVQENTPLLGSGLAVGASALPVLEQLGILEELQVNSKPMRFLTAMTEQRNVIGSIDFTDYEERTGYEGRVLARGKFHSILRSLVPDENICLGKQLQYYEQDINGVRLYFTDGTTDYGHVLIGADGAYSNVRKTLYKNLSAQGLLDPRDSLEMTFTSISIVGTTQFPQDPEQYAVLKDQFARYETVVARPDGVCGNACSLVDNRIAWMITKEFPRKLRRTDPEFLQSEWSYFSAEELCELTRSIPCPFGGTMGNLIDATPTELITKVKFEEGIFRTWYDGRVVLMGDSMHKMHPCAGQGASCAIMDAVVLVNNLFQLDSNHALAIEKAFAHYQQVQYANAVQKVTLSRIINGAFVARNFKGRILQNVVLRYLPAWLNRFALDVSAYFRPQASFLRQVANKGLGYVFPPLYSTERIKQLQYA